MVLVTPNMNYQSGLSLRASAARPRRSRAPVFGLGAAIECRQTGTRFTIVGTPQDCEYLPTGEPVYLCCEDTLDRRIVVIPEHHVEADMVATPAHPIIDRRVPGTGDRRNRD